MSWKSSSIVSYPDSDDDNDPLHYIKKSRPKQENVQYNPVYKNKTGKTSGHPRDPRLENRNRDPRLQPRNNETRDPRHQSNNVENRDPRHTAKNEVENIHYAPVYNRKVRDIEREYENASRSNSYESAGARWKQYKSEKAAEISRPDKYQSAESGWKKLKSENKWDTSNWTNASDSSDDDGDNYNRKTPKSKIDIFANSEEETYKEEKSNEQGFWWKYKDDEPLPDSLILESASKSEEKNDDLFDDILSGNLVESNKGNEKDEFNDDFLYDDVLMQSRKVLEEGKAFLGESVSETQDERSDQHKFMYETERSFMNDSSSLQFKPVDNVETQNRYNVGDLYREQVDVNDRKYDDLYKEVDDDNDTWSRSVTVEKKEVSNWSDESLSPIRRQEPSPDRNVEVNLVKKRSPRRSRDDSPSYERSRENREEDTLSPYDNGEYRDNRKMDSISSSYPNQNRKDDNISSYTNRSPPSRSPSRRDHPQKPPVNQSAQPIIGNPYENPKLNVDNIDLYFNDLMEWNYSHRCLICDKTFDNLTKWTEHILDTKHGREFHLDPYRCPPCHEMFRNKQEWKMHMAYAPSHGFMGSINVPKTYTVLPPSPAFPVQHGWRCKSCYIISQTDDDALRHIKYVHLIHTALYPCPLCGEPFWHQRDLDRHADDVHAPPKYQCDICQRAFESGEKLQTHRLIKHSKKITCYKCEKQIDELIFKEHCEMHKLEMRKCDYCGDVFKDSYHLEKHVRHDHKKHRRRHRSSSRSPDRRSSRRRSRRSRSRSKRSSSKSRRSSTKDEQGKIEPKTRRSSSPTNQEPSKQKTKESKRSMSQDESSIPSSSCATPTRDEEEDIFPPGDENYRHSSPNRNQETMEVAPAEEEDSRQSRECSTTRSPLGRRDSLEDDRCSRGSDKSRDYRRTRSTSQSSIDRRSSRHKRSRSRDDNSSRRYSSRKRSRSQSRSRSRSRDRGYSSSKGSKYDEDDRSNDRHLEDRVYKEYDERSNDARKRFISETLNDSSSNAFIDDSIHDDDGGGQEEETEWERRISMKMIVKDEIWDKEEDEKANSAPAKMAPKDLPIFDIPVEEDIEKSSSEKPIENATWVVEKPLGENKDSKNGNESDNDEDKKQFVCKECGKSLGSLMQLRDHFTVKHKKGFNLRNKRPSSADVKKSQPIVAKEPKLSEEQKEIAKLIEGIE
ncbi:uncharacterized protein LOC133194066 [Saccostrea echinata]|uniref:uncharacterized protein LOC133194066 n=1 Tax=Saccostrea echinata TaxID=191078 RepID=UPI002A7FD94C|nr:uncharacterized protein LOC133194066 [Saccostrea echinata]XP_061185995.1 uncharacterized protein LOC133194066 [Saccostrea echinata]